MILVSTAKSTGRAGRLACLIPLMKAKAAAGSNIVTVVNAYPAPRIFAKKRKLAVSSAMEDVSWSAHRMRLVGALKNNSLKNAQLIKFAMHTEKNVPMSAIQSALLVAQKENPMAAAAGVK